MNNNNTYTQPPTPCTPVPEGVRGCSLEASVLELLAGTRLLSVLTEFSYSTKANKPKNQAPLHPATLKVVP